ncbi:hypothetical protein TNCT_694281 [Trichonephila clavata]|uniref:Uncharacterized protein n=1 Tax=Trichonephila clavata TaxID=2740835 RepID=A0A8X6HA12_TRICU|nr:hypothetical protein TNCT_694281 [Trichonephila clavata]
MKILIKIQKDQPDNESDATDINLSDYEIESKKEVNEIEFSSGEDEDLRYIANSYQKRAWVIIFDFETERDFNRYIF